MSAEIVDLNEYRARRNAEREQAGGQQTKRAIGYPVIWVPIWFVAPMFCPRPYRLEYAGAASAT